MPPLRTCIGLCAVAMDEASLVLKANPATCALDCFFFLAFRNLPHLLNHQFLSLHTTLPWDLSSFKWPPLTTQPYATIISNCQWSPFLHLAFTHQTIPDILWIPLLLRLLMSRLSVTSLLLNLIVVGLLRCMFPCLCGSFSSST